MGGGGVRVDVKLRSEAFVKIQKKNFFLGGGGGGGVWGGALGWGSGWM